MAWLGVHQELRDHRKIFALADELNIPSAHAIGLVVSLWLWAITNAETGDLSRVTHRTIARAAQWEGDPDLFWDALTKVGFIDADTGALHDWDEYAGKLMEKKTLKRQQDRERQRLRRQRTYGNTRAGNVTQTSCVTRTGVAGGTEHNITINSTSELPEVSTDMADKSRKAFEHDSKPYQAAAYLDEAIRERLPSKPPADEKTLQRWALDFDRLHRLDKQPWDFIGEVLEFSQANSFWSKNILSGQKFREKYFQLMAKMEGQQDGYD